MKLKISLLVLSVMLLMAFSPPLQRVVFGEVVIKKLTVQNAATFQDAVTFDSTVAQSGASTFSAAATFSDDVQTAGIVGHTATSYALTGAQTLTPTTTYYELSPATVLTLTLASGTAGDILILANTVTTSTTIVDTGATVGGGVVTLGENDVAAFIKVDDTWAELYSPDNS